jgi:hypothetical protein
MRKEEFVAWMRRVVGPLRATRKSSFTESITITMQVTPELQQKLLNGEKLTIEINLTPGGNGHGTGLEN